MGLLTNYRKNRQERRRKRQEAQAEALKSLHDEPSATRGAAFRGDKPDGDPRAKRS
jgi:hypothetical protein